MMIRNLIRAIITLLFGALGFYVDYLLLNLNVLQTLGWSLPEIWTYLAMVLIFAVIGFLIAPAAINGFLTLVRFMDTRLARISIQELIGGAIGVIVGLIISSLFNNSFKDIPFIGPIISVLISLLLGYLGLIIGIKRREEIFAVLNFLPRFKGDKDKNKESSPMKAAQPNYKILDTSVIIDGRIADIVQTGFIEGTLLIPNFVLEELRHIADSSDLLKRNRGRRGLDILNQISKETKVQVEIYEQDFDDIQEVDSKLVRLGQVLNAPILTNDYNLNKVAELQGVTVLNINELANALKPVVLPGEEMTVQVMKEGKEPGQGIAYLDDGTMIVVDTGRRYIGHHIPVLVTSVLQTAAGRMIFAKPKPAAPEKKNDFHEENGVNALG